MKFHKKNTLAVLFSGVFFSLGTVTHAAAKPAMTVGITGEMTDLDTVNVKQGWGHWLQQQIRQHPDIIAAKAALNAQLSLAQGSEKRLYNPELTSEFEQEGSNENFRLGINQTFDWWDKRSVRIKQAGYDRLAAEQSYKSLLQKKTAEALLALAKWQSVNSMAELARSQESQLNTLIKLVQARQASGDLSQIDAELAFLSLSQKLNTTAKAQAELKQVESDLRQLLPEWTVSSPVIPETLWQLTNENASINLARHPDILVAQARWQGLKQAAAIAQLETKVDPTFGINAGKSANENVLALSVSLPLNINNDYSSEARAANQNAASAEASYRSVRRKLEFSLSASKDVFLEYQQRYQRWLVLMEGRAERSSRLLGTQWRSGDLSTSEYLLALQQRSEGLAAGIELRSAYQAAKIDWLLQTGELDIVIKQLAAFAK